MSAHDVEPRDKGLPSALAAYFGLLEGEPGPRIGADDDGIEAEWKSRFERARSCVELLAKVWPSPSDLPVTAGLAGGCKGEPVRVGRFELKRELGRGAYGVVVLAHDPNLNRDVALKLPRPEVLIDDSLRQRFLREAQAAARLDHPNLVRVFEAGETGPVCYIAQEYCAGQTLAEWLRSRSEPVSLSLAARTVAVLAAAVDHAHRHGILHRDLKPANVILEPRAADKADSIAPRDQLPFTPKVADFGLAKSIEQDRDDTRTGTLLGTPQYMAPEQADGRTREVGPRTDIYSLGTILYELLTLEPPFHGETPLETLRRAALEEPVPPRRLRPDVPADLEAVCLRCLEKDPRRRYDSAGALADDLTRFLTGAPTIARPLGTVHRAWKWAMRKPAVAALLALSLVTTLVLCVAFAWHTVTLRGALDVAEQRRLEAQHLGTLVHEREQRMRQFSYTSDMKLADEAWKKSHVPQTIELLERYRQDPAAKKLRTFAWHRLWRLCNRHSLQLRAHTGDVYCVAFSPDGRTLATCGADGSARLWDASTGEQLTELGGHAGEVSNVCFSPDGRTLATCGEDRTVRLWDCSSGLQVAKLAGHSAGLFSIAFSPNGKLLASGAKDRLVKIWDVGQRTELRTLEGHSGAIEALAFSPDGSLLATGSGDETIKLWDLDTGRTLATLRGHAGVVLSVAFSPDGLTLASGAEDRAVKLWEVEGGKEIDTLAGHAEVVQSVAFSPDGQTLAAAVKDGAVQFWNVRNGEPAGNLRGHTARVWYIAFTPDGKRLATASGDGTVRVWDTSARREGRRLAVHSFKIRSLAFSRNEGRFVAAFVDTHGDQGTIEVLIFDIDSDPRSWRSQLGPVAHVAFSADGAQLASARQIPHGQPTHQEVNTLVASSGHVLTTMTDNIANRLRSSNLRCVSRSPDGRYVATGSDDGLLSLWNVHRRIRRNLDGHVDGVTALAFSPDGTVLASGALDQTVRLWNVTTASERSTLRGHGGSVHALAFTPDGRTLTTAGTNGTLMLWDVDSGKRLATIEAHGTTIQCSIFSPDGRTLVTGADDGTVKLWDVATLQEVATWKAHTASVRCAAFSSDGKLLATGAVADDGASEVVLWRADAPAIAPSAPKESPIAQQR